MSYLDIILIIPLAWSIYKGFKRGLIIEIASLVGLVLGIYGALNFSDYTEVLLRENYDIDFEYMHLLSFAITFIGIVILVYILGKVLEKIINIIALGIFNKIAGMFFGFFKMSLILSMVLLIVEGINANVGFIKPEDKEASVLYTPIARIGPSILLLIDDFEMVEEVLKKSQIEKESLPF